MPQFRAKIEGMDCVTCAKSIEKGVSSLGYQCQVDFVNSELIIENEKVNPDEIKKRVEALGYKIYFGDKEIKENKTFFLKLAIALGFTIPLWLGMFIETLHNPVLQLFFATPVMFLGWMHFGKSAWNSLKMRNPNMDVLVTLGGSVAYFYSIYETFIGKNPDYIFYETAASIFTIVLIGNYLEHFALGKTRRELEDLQRMAPVKARKIFPDETISEVQVSEINAGDKLKIVTGDNVPTDGVLVEGKILVNEALITGESRPVTKEKGDNVLSGSVVVEGNGIIRAETHVADSTLSRIINLTKEAGSKKADMQRLADKISAIFVPIIILISLLTFIGNYWFFGISLLRSVSNAIAVLVIACPCALGIATPVAIVVGVGRSAKYGILIRDANAFEKLAKAKYVLLDKTGTLTEGRFRILEEKVLDERYSLREIHSIVYALEQYSNHPVAWFFREEFKEAEPFSLKNVKEIPGKGLQATDTQGNLIRFGRFERDEEGIGLRINDTRIYFVKIGDKIKRDAREFIAELKRLGIVPVLVSGDNRENCLHVAEKLGIGQVFYEVLPEEKLRIVSEFVVKGITVMLGDGINDAPALAKADVGIAVGKENALSVASASVILLNTQIETFLKTFRIGKKVYRNIRQNLFWAFFYNVLAVPFAAVGYVRPMFGATAMALSDVVVVTNALLMRRKL